MELKEGDVLCFKWNSFYSSLIYFSNFVNYGKKGFSHCGIIGEIDKNKVVVYEALNRGFVKVYYGKTEIDNYIHEGYLNIYRPKYKLSSVKKNCENFLGRSYGWLDIFAIGFYTIFGDYALKWSANANKIICSEAVARILYKSNNKINISKEYNKKFSYITPMDISESKFLKKVK